MKRDTCPLCGNATAPEPRPFCSRGCRDRALLTWLGEGYRIPAEPADAQARTGLDTVPDAD